MLALLVALSSARADTADEVVTRARAANRVDSAIETVRMTVVPKPGAGSPRVKEFEIRTRRTADASMTHMRFTSPSTEAGTQFLLLDHETGPDERLAWTPARKLITMVAPGSNGRLVGSDITFEDLAIRDAVSGAHTLVEDTPTHWVIDTALQGGSYTRVRTTIGKADLVARKLEFFDAAGAVKVLEVVRTEKDGAVTLPVETTMTDLRRGTKTKLEILTHRLNVPAAELPDETFTRAYMERG